MVIGLASSSWVFSAGFTIGFLHPFRIGLLLPIFLRKKFKKFWQRHFENGFVHRFYTRLLPPMGAFQNACAKCFNFFCQKKMEESKRIKLTANLSLYRNFSRSAEAIKLKGNLKPHHFQKAFANFFNFFSQKNLEKANLEDETQVNEQASEQNLQETYQNIPFQKASGKFF